MKYEQEHLEEKLRKFPRHELSENERKKIHETLMNSRVHRTRQKSSVFRGRKIAVSLASVAALALFTVLGLSFFPNVFTYTNENAQPLFEELGHENTDHDLDKQAPDTSQSDNNDDASNNNVESDNPIVTDMDIQTLSDQVIDLLDRQDMESLAHYVHPEKGLLFSPYVYVTEDAVVFSKSEVGLMLTRDEPFNWGNYDGKGTPIKLNPAAYFAEFMDMTPFKNPDKILVDNIQRRGNTENNIKEVFPDAEIIEYYNKGSEEYAGIDWSSVWLVYETDASGLLKLIAIVRDMWTI